MNQTTLRKLYQKQFEANSKLSAVAFRRAIRKDVKELNPKNIGELNLLSVNNLRKAMIDRYEKNGIKFGNTVYNDYSAQLNQKRFNPVFSRSWARFVRTIYATQLLSEIVSIRGTIVEEVAREVNNAITEGEDIVTLSKAIETVVNSNAFYRWQAERIARTEVGAAMNRANELAVDELGIDVDKRWVSGLDGRERASHRNINGQVVGKDETFANGLKIPHEAGAPASEVINCRCVLQYLPKNSNN